jgi:glyoxylase-like metal-dependent hydrolase (beta-lactamase superfamily II)
VFAVEYHGQLTRVRCGRTLAGHVLHEVSCFLVGDTLVDSGCPATSRELVRWCADRGVTRVVHTHHHEDHTGGDAELVRSIGVEVVAPPRTVPILRAFYRLPWYRSMVWGRAESAPCRAMGTSVRIGDARYEVVPTPGHASDHVCLFQSELGWVFTGDLFISRRVRYLRTVEDAQRILESLRVVRGLEPSLLICSHAGLVRDAVAALDERIADWEDVARQTARLLDEGVRLAGATRRVLGREGPMTVISCGDFAKQNLVRSLVEGRG